MLLILTSKKQIGSKMKTFLLLLKNHLDKKSLDFSVSNFEEIEVFIQKGDVRMNIAGVPLQKWTTVYPRKVGKYRGLAHMLAHLSIKNNIFFIDRFHTHTKDSSDVAKILQMFHLALNHVSIPKTYVSATYTKKQIKNAVAYLGLPLVVKETNTSQGSGVFLAKTIESLQQILQERSLTKVGREIFLQEFIPNTFEYRILVMGDKSAVAEKKIRSQDEEFRNNVHLGAKEEFISLQQVPSTVKDTAELAARVTNIQIAGIDVIENSSGIPIVFEVNSCPAFTLDEIISPEIRSLSNYLILCEKK
ncbi:MAG: ATP-grasp domain-containing protein [Candidatus Moranbacteria bacterium]|jgi:glutathione synthase/RimK-type ligase-like ATP-grasp enzyme|nr:ATP-grasp domain-containing protein [Candidatus Moranbacteria bacterium]